MNVLITATALQLLMNGQRRTRESPPSMHFNGRRIRTAEDGHSDMSRHHSQALAGSPDFVETFVPGSAVMMQMTSRAACLPVSCVEII